MDRMWNTVHARRVVRKSSKIVCAVACCLAISSCAAFKSGGTLGLDSPIAQGLITVASFAECKAWAERSPGQAEDYILKLQAIELATGACTDGLRAGLPHDGDGDGGDEAMLWVPPQVSAQ